MERHHVNFEHFENGEVGYCGMLSGVRESLFKQILRLGLKKNRKL